MVVVGINRKGRKIDKRMQKRNESRKRLVKEERERAYNRMLRIAWAEGASIEDLKKIEIKKTPIINIREERVEISRRIEERRLGKSYTHETDLKASDTEERVTYLESFCKWLTE